MTTKTKRLSKCCNYEIINWFGNVTPVILGAPMPGPTTCCMKCGKPCEANPT